MVKRSLQASPSGSQQAKRAFALKGWTQENLAAEVNLKTRQPIWRFFSGQPVDRQIFLAICSILDLDWRELAQNPPAQFPEPGEKVGVALRDPSLDIAPLEIDRLVQEVRSQYWETIHNQCGVLQLLHINHPVSLDDIYVDINVLEESKQQHLGLAELQALNPTDFDRVRLENIEQLQISGVQAVATYSKLRVLGQPGTGKTTFLKYLAIQCNQGELATHRVPIFITLRDFAEESRDRGKFNLLNYIHQNWLITRISNPAALEALLKAGRILFLIDGLDEMLKQDSAAVLREVRRFIGKYHTNQFIATCRTADPKLQLQGFTDIEMAPLTQTQIATFAQKWFITLTQKPRSGQTQFKQFLQKLNLSENWQFRQLVANPLFLHLACWVFQQQQKFPDQRTEFYQQGLDLLLGKWDEVRGIERDEVSRDFGLPQKLRLLSQLATVTFEQGQYFFEQRTLEYYIGDYLQNLPGAVLEPEELQLESASILKAIEAQHGILVERNQGIFSFSYFVFQEYFTARKIVASPNLSALEQSLRGLVNHITEPAWHGVFLLTIAMLRSADSLVQLMKQHIDALVVQAPHVQEFLIWASQSSGSTPAMSKQLNATIAHYCNIHHAWQFSPEQQQLLQRYYRANQLLVDCLDSNCHVTAVIRQEIEATLLLP